MSHNKYSCDCSIVHREAVEQVIKSLPADGVLARVAEFFKILGDPTRTKIICTLLEGEMCVCDIANVLGMTKSAVSHQLGMLRRADLVAFRREGKNVFYSLSDGHVRGMIESGLEHVHQ